MNTGTKIYRIVVIVLLAAVMIVGCVLLFNRPTAKSAYDLAVENGFSGSVTEWLESLQGEDGEDGKTEYYQSLYSQAVEKYSYTGSFDEFLAEYVKGDKGDSSITAAVNKAINSVVSINSSFSGVRKTVFGGSENINFTGAGAGVILELDKQNGDAYIVTNYHVVYTADYSAGMAKSIKLYLFGMEYEQYAIEGQYIGGSLNYDIAVLKINGSEILKESGAVAAIVADSDNLRAGMEVVAIGNPEASNISATSGIVSVDSETISMTGADNATTVSFRVVRIDAAINGGNSGGGLFNSEGELVGIVNAKIVDESIENMAFALPSNVSVSVARNIIKNCNGVSKTSPSVCELGVELSIGESRAVFNPETQLTDIVQKIYVEEVKSGSVAYGVLKEGDLLLSVGSAGKTIQIDRDFKLSDFLLGLNKNDEISLVIERNGSKKTLILTLSKTVEVN